MSDVSQDPEVRETSVRGITDDDILDDLRAACARVRCPVHDVPPSFERQSNGSIVEAFCCATLAQIFRELRAEEEELGSR
jgi:hypothetical protein